MRKRVAVVVNSDFNDIAWVLLFAVPGGPVGRSDEAAVGGAESRHTAGEIARARWVDIPRHTTPEDPLRPPRARGNPSRDPNHQQMHTPRRSGSRGRPMDPAVSATA